ncbi:MAG: hypothetical protein WCG47_24540 [Dermatophilaceae bacterium]
MRPDRRLRVAATGILATAFLAVPAATQSSAADAPSFPHPLDTDSRYFPLTPGARYVYEGTVTDAEGTHEHRIVFTVTDLVKRVDGMNARVILDLDYNDGVLSEAELAFFAQDSDDNVYTRGEYPEEYEQGDFVGAPSTWISGERRAKAGILVPGHPKAGTAPFSQGTAPAVEFNDVGQVVATGLKVCVATGCYTDVVKIQEWDPSAPQDGRQLKYYAPNVGLVKIGARGGDSQEATELVSQTMLGPAALSSVRDDALRLDRRAFRISKDYNATSPAHPQD